MKNKSSMTYYAYNKRPSERAYRLKGFTLIELLVSISIIGIVGTSTVSILYATLRAGKKSDTLITLRQSGNAVTSQVVKNIRYAKTLDYPSSCIPSVGTSSITVTSIDNVQSTFACSGGAAPSVTHNGVALTDTNTTVVSQCSFICTQSTLNDPPAINFKFKLSAKSSGALESSGAIPFQSSVILRNYSR